MARASTTASAAAFAVVLLAMWACAGLLALVGAVFAYGEVPEPPTTVATPSWYKFVAFGLAMVVAAASFPVAAVAARAVERSVERQPA
jgi:uncharacterized membrane protein